MKVPKGIIGTFRFILVLSYLPEPKAKQIWSTRPRASVHLRRLLQLRKPPRIYLAGAMPPDSIEPSSGAHVNATLTLPDSFKVRERWPECKNITDTIHDQPCSNCWAYSSSGVMSDRTCIASSGQVQARLSADDLTTCCTACAAV